MRVAQDVAAQAAAASAKWIAVKEWSGGVNLEQVVKERFDRPAGVWRLSYTTDAGTAARSGVVDITVWTKDNKLMASAYNVQGTAAGHLHVKGEQPEYFVEVRSFGPRWRIVIERSE